MVCALAAVAHADAAIPSAASGGLRCEGYDDWARHRGTAGESRGRSFVERRQGRFKISHFEFGNNGEETRVVDAATGMMLYSIPNWPAEIVFDRAQQIVGALVIRFWGLEFFDAAGRAKWFHTEDGLAGEDSAAVVLDGNSLIVAIYRFRNTGARLFRISLASGTIQWQAQVEQLKVDHPADWNDVTLELRDGKIVMRGDESGGCYVQTFDPATGKRLSSVKR